MYQQLTWRRRNTADLQKGHLPIDLHEMCTTNANLTTLLQNLEIFDKWRKPFLFLLSQNFLREILSRPTEKQINGKT